MPSRRATRANALGLALGLAASRAQKVEWVETARFKDGTTALLKEREPLRMQPMASPPPTHTLQIDTSHKYQEIVGFGGAFTEAAAINWKLLSAADQDEVIRLYFAGPEEGGHGYSLGRVPINSCDFSPGSYSFDDSEGDVELKHFDHSVQHDVDSGMIPMILAAKARAEARGASLTMYASPWSPPAWMKQPSVEGVQSMVVSATPNGLMPSMQRAWATYFSKFVSAYRARGVELWGVTVQNEPEAAVGWEACLYTAEFMAAFVRDHLGPVLEAEQPGLKIIGFDHNKDHVAEWAKALYADADAKKYFAGVGVHWYGGLNTHNLQATHEIAPEKFILATEACNCGGVVFEAPSLSAWWTRAESLGLDMLEDLRYWAVGWTDWNLVLSPQGGPNHLKNLCDANIIADPTRSLGKGTLVMQASYYYMGHFSRYIPPGARRVKVANSVESHAPPLEPDDVKNGQALLFAPCDGSDVQKWALDRDSGALTVRGTDVAEGSEGYGAGGECADVANDVTWGKLQTWACAHSANQQWVVEPVDGGYRISNPPSGKCMMAVSTAGSAVGLDAGLTVVAAQLKDCAAAGSAGAAAQTFVVQNYDAQGFPGNFPVRTLASAPGGGELCLQPQIVRVPHFDAVAFELPDGSLSLVAMNIGDNAVDFALHDKASSAGVSKLTLNPHSIVTYRWKPGGETLAAVSALARTGAGAGAGAGAAPGADAPRAGSSAPALVALAVLAAVLGVASQGRGRSAYHALLGAARGGRDDLEVARDYEEWAPARMATDADGADGGR